jgi:hypothetical protein
MCCPPHARCPCSKAIYITQPGWHILQHLFTPTTCTDASYPTGSKCVLAQLKLFKAFAGGSCGSIVTNGAATASWDVAPRAASNFGGTVISDNVAEVGGTRYVDVFQ